MALMGSNKGIVKNDINFFAAFTASARKQAQALALVAIVALVCVGIALAFLAGQAFTYFKLTSDVNGLKEELAKPEYAELDAQSRSLQEEVTRRTQYLYTLSSMRRSVDEVVPASTALVDLLGDSVPNDAYIESYTFTGTDGQIAGYAYNYYSALNMLNALQATDVFENSDVSIERITLDNGNDEYVDGVLYQESVYLFSITGTLTSDIYVSLTMFYNDGTTTTALSGVQTQSVKPGEAYQFDGISTYNEYTLTAVKINGDYVSEDELNSFLASDSISGVSQRNVTIECYYSAVVAEEGEA